MARRVKHADPDPARERRCAICESARFVPFRWPPSSPAAAESFDGYYIWLGIPPSDQPPHHYRLLGINLYEANPAIINNASDQQMNYLRALQTSPHAEQAQRILGEIAAARTCLLDEQAKARYDSQLRTHLAKVGSDPPRQPSLLTAKASAGSPARPKESSSHASPEAGQTLEKDSDAAGTQSSRGTDESAAASEKAEFVALKGNTVELRHTDSGKTVALSIDQLGESAYSVMNRDPNTLLELGKKISAASPRHKWEIWSAGGRYILVIAGTTRNKRGE